MGLILGTQLLAANVTQPYPDPGLKRTPIKVALLSLPPRTQSLLEFFFTNAGRGSFMACAEAQAETAIFDLDTPASRDHWLVYNARTGCPGIALAVKPQDVPGALWVQKPVTPAALLAAAASLRAAASAPPAERVAPIPATLTPEPAAVPVAASMTPAAPTLPTPVATAVPAAIAPVTADPSPMPPVPAPAPTEPATPPMAHLASEQADAAPIAAPAAPLPPVVAASEPPAEALMPAAPSDSPPAKTPASVSAAASPVPPAAEPTASGKTFWQRLFGTAARKPAAAPASWAVEEPATPAPAVAADPAPAAAMAGQPDPAPAAEAEPQEGASQAAAEPTSAKAVSEPAESMSPAAPVHSAGEVLAQQASETTAWVALDHAVAVAEADEQAANAVVAEQAPEPDEATTVSGFLATEPAQPPSEPSEDLPAANATPSDSASEALFGSRADVPAKELAESAALRYDPEKYLVGVLREAFMVATKWEVPTQFDCGAGFLVIDAERNELHSSLDEDELQALASTALSKRSKVQTLSNLDYVRFKQALQDSGKARCTRLDDAIWRAAMWGSAGRLPAGTNPSRTIFLRHWPNLTRITPVPQGPRLAALWALRGGTVLDSCKQFNLPQRHVIGFYNGVWALNLLTEDGSFARRTQRKGARNRGLLTRLLGWLRR